MFFRKSLFFLIVSATSSVWSAQSVNLAWDPSPDPSVVGYSVYFGPVPGYYTNRLDAGNALAITTPPLPDGIYYFSATAHDANGNESDFSNIVGTNIVTTFSPSGPIGLSNMTANADGSIAFIWGATPGANYTLQYKSNLLDAQWTTIGSSVAAAKSIFLSDTPAVPQRFYRLISGTTIGAPVGFLNLSLLGNSDNYISLPFARPGAITTSVASVSANVITPGGSPNWQPGQFVYASGTQSNTYYARFASGGAEGRIFRITNNSANTLSLDLGTDTNIDGINAGDSLSIEPYWTFASVFPNGNGVNASATIGNRSTEIIIPATTNAGMDLSAAKIYYVNAGVWKQVGQGNTNYNDDVLPPNSYFVVRHNVSTNTLLTTFGAVVTSKLAFSIRPGTTDKQDNPIGLMRPIPLSLDESGLIASGAFSPSLLPGSRTDELLTYDNTVASRNKSPSASYYYWNGAWRQVGAGINNVGPNRIFGAGAAIIIRKATNSAPVLWTSPANY